MSLTSMKINIKYLWILSWRETSAIDLVTQYWKHWNNNCVLQAFAAAAVQLQTYNNNLPNTFFLQTSLLTQSLLVCRHYPPKQLWRTWKAFQAKASLCVAVKSVLWNVWCLCSFLHWIAFVHFSGKERLHGFQHILFLNNLSLKSNPQMLVLHLLNWSKEMKFIIQLCFKW